MLLPQIIKRLIYPGRPGKVRPDREQAPGTESAPARSGEEALENTVETQKQAQPRTPDR